MSFASATGVQMANFRKYLKKCSFRAPPGGDPGIFCGFWPQIWILWVEKHNISIRLSTHPSLSEKNNYVSKSSQKILESMIFMLVAGPSRLILGLCIHFWSIKRINNGYFMHTLQLNWCKGSIFPNMVVRVAKISQKWPKCSFGANVHYDPARFRGFWTQNRNLWVKKQHICHPLSKWSWLRQKKWS